MANLISPTNVFPSGAGYLSQYVIGQCETTDTFSKIHIKLDVARSNTVNTMAMIEAVGFAFGSSQAIRSSWCFYQYQSLLYSVGVANVYPGLTAEAVYYSSDNFVCLRGSIASYYSGFVLNAYVNSGDGDGRLINVTASNWNNNAGNFY